MTIADEEASTIEDPTDREFVRSAVGYFHPGNRPHPVEWKPDPIEGRLFLGLSSTVKNPAFDYAKRIVGQAEDPDEHEGFYGAEGNRLAELHFNTLTPYQENQVRIPLDSEYDLVGHLDGILVYDPDTGANLSHVEPGAWPKAIGLRVLEHKHQDPDEGIEAGGKVDLAERQAALGLAMLEMHLARLVTLGKPMALVVPPDFQEGRVVPARPLTIPSHVESVACDRVGIHFWPRTAPRARVIPHIIPQDVRARLRSDYTRKAYAVITAVRAKEPGLALDAWDLTPDGLQEFRRTPEARMAGIDPAELLTACQEMEHARQQLEKWEAVRQDRSAKGVAILKEKGVKSVEIQDPKTGAVLAKPTAVNTAKSQYLKANLRGVP